MKKIIKKILHCLGFSVQRNYNKNKERSIRNPYLTHFFDVLKTIGYTPQIVIDIGANRGHWTRDILQIFPDAQVTMIEPQENLKTHLEDILKKPNVTYLPIGMGSQCGSFQFTLNKYDDSSTFLLSEEEALKRGFSQVEVPVKTLNYLLQNNEIAMPDMVKIDAEGLDLQVLEGASELFGQTEIFLVEAAINNPLFPNTFFKVMQFMEQHGYRLFDITDHNRPFRPKMLWLAELAFVKKGGRVDQYRISDFKRN